MSWKIEFNIFKESESPPASFDTGGRISYQNKLIGIFKQTEYSGGTLMAEKESKPVVKHEIMEKPLPVILDEISSSIELADKAAADARAAANEARLAGEKAAEEVMRRIRKVFLKMSRDITEELKETEK